MSGRRAFCIHLWYPIMDASSILLMILILIIKETVSSPFFSTVIPNVHCFLKFRGNLRHPLSQRSCGIVSLLEREQRLCDMNTYHLLNPRGLIYLHLPQFLTLCSLLEGGLMLLLTQLTICRQFNLHVCLSSQQGKSTTHRFSTKISQGLFATFCANGLTPQFFILF